MMSTSSPRPRGDQGKKKPPASLIYLAANTIVDISLQSAANRLSGIECVADLLETVPQNLANLLVAQFLLRYVEVVGTAGADAALPDPVRLLDLLGPPLSTIDLSVLMKLGRREHAELLAFNNRMVSRLPRLGQLVRLVLVTHGKDFTLPVCYDGLLEQIATHCPRLQSLDVSHNTGVSADGLQRLCSGCPLLQELFLFDCVIPCSVLVTVLRALPHLRQLGHKELGPALLALWRRCAQPLRLTHVTNVGEQATSRLTSPGGLPLPNRLRCDWKLTRALARLCPALESLRVRILDEDVPRLAALPRLNSLELRYHASKRLTSVGSHTLSYLRDFGSRLVVLTVFSRNIRRGHFARIGEHCPLLQKLWVRTNYITGDCPVRQNPSSKLFTHLQSLSVRVGWDEECVCDFPAALLKFVLRDVGALKRLFVAVNSEDLNNAWLADVLHSFDTSELLTLFVLLPNLNAKPAALSMTMTSVELARALCPSLEELGNLLVWSVLGEEVRHLQQDLLRENSILRLVHKETVWR